MRFGSVFTNPVTIIIIINNNVPYHTYACIFSICVWGFPYMYTCMGTEPICVWEFLYVYGTCSYTRMGRACWISSLEIFLFMKHHKLIWLHLLANWSSMLLLTAAGLFVCEQFSPTCMDRLTKLVGNQQFVLSIAVINLTNSRLAIAIYSWLLFCDQDYIIYRKSPFWCTTMWLCDKQTMKGKNLMEKLL